MPLSIDFSISRRRVMPAVFFLALCALSVVVVGGLADGAFVGGGLADCVAGAGALAGGVCAAGSAGAAGAAGAAVVAGAAGAPGSGAFCANTKPRGVQRRIAVAAREAMVRIEDSQFFTAQNQIVRSPDLK